MSLLIANCPRCGAGEITFDLKAQVLVAQSYGWKNHYEVFCICRRCHRPTIFLVSINESHYVHEFGQENALVKFNSAINPFFTIERFISVRDNTAEKPPEYLPQEIEDIFIEGAACLSIGCHNAAATMFRLCVDYATIPLLPDTNSTACPHPNNKQRNNLFHRLTWLFDNSLLPLALHGLADCIREDGNDGAHVGNLSKEDANDLLDFTIGLLEQLYTNPKKLELAKERRQSRRSS